MYSSLPIQGQVNTSNIGKTHQLETTMTNMLWLLGGVMGFVLIALVYDHTRSSLSHQKRLPGWYDRVMSWCVHQLFQFPNMAGWFTIGFVLLGIPLGFVLRRYGISIPLTTLMNN